MRHRLTWQEGIDLIKEQDAEELVDFRREIPCAGPYIVYILKDERVLELYPHEGVIHNNISEFYEVILRQRRYQYVKHISKTLPRKGIEYLPGGGKVYFFEIAEFEGRPMRSAFKSLDKADFATDADEIYLSPDGEVIEYMKEWTNPYRLFDCMATYLKLDTKRRIPKKLKDIPETIGDKHDPYFRMFMCGRNPYGEHFPNMAEELAEQLPELINAPEGLLTYSGESFPKLEKYFYRQIITADFADATFLPLLAYLGLTLINVKGGKWEMKYRSSYDSWSPYVVTKDGQRIQFLKGLIDLFDWRGGSYYPFKALYSTVPRT